MKLEGVVFELEPAGFDFGKVKNVVDDGQEGVGAAAGGLDIVPLFVGQFGIEEQGRHAQHTVHRGADFVAHVGQELGFGERGLFELLIQGDEGGIALDQLLLAFAQGAISGIALQQVQVGHRVVTQSSDQLDLVRQLYQVVVGTERESASLDLRILVRGENNDRDVLCVGVRAELTHQRQAVDARHH